MDTVIAILIVAVAAYYVFNKVRKQLDVKNGGGCGCSGGCGGCQQDSDCSCDK